MSPIGCTRSGSRVGVAAEAVEASRSPRWTPGEACRRVFGDIVSGVVAFRVHVREQQRIFKLSQDGGR